MKIHLGLIKRDYLFYAVFILLFLSFSCTRDILEEVYLDEELALRFNSEILPIMDSKCFNCHNYHLEEGLRYDNYEKFLNSANKIKTRVLSNNANLQMPPSNHEALSKNELIKILEFLNYNQKSILDDDIPEEISISWTAYKYPTFKSRVGVTGSFKDIFIEQTIVQPRSIADQFLNTKIEIPLSGAFIEGNKLGTKNIVNHFFKFLGTTVYAEIIGLKGNELAISIKMNGEEEILPFLLEDLESHYKISGTISDMAVFKWDVAYNALNLVAGEYHQEMLWPDIDIEVLIPKI